MTDTDTRRADHADSHLDHHASEAGRRPISRRRRAVVEHTTAERLAGARRIFRSTTVTVVPAPAPDRRPGQQLVHDIGHEMGTVGMLAAALQHGPDLGTESRHLAGQLVTEVRRATELTSLLCQQLGHSAAPRREQRSDVRLDELLHSIAEPVRLTSSVDISVVAMGVVVHQNRLALWRAVRNVVCNALDATEPDGVIHIRLFLRDGYAIIDIDDDGPGMNTEASRPGGLGLSIVEELTAGWGGWFEVGPSVLGGCRVRLLVPLPAAHEAR